MLILSGTSHPTLAKEIASHLGRGLGRVEIGTFPDGEVSVELLDPVRDEDVFVVQSLARRPQEYLVELLVLIDALKRAGAASIVPVIPYFGYGRQDRRVAREPITAKLVASLLERAGASRLITLDLHSGQIEGFFDVPVENLSAQGELMGAIGQLDGDWVIGCADVGGIKIARGWADRIGLPMVVVDKRRLGASEVVASTVIGSVEDKNVLLVDDMCSTGSTLVEAAKLCKSKGASRILAAVTHGLMLSPQTSPIEKIWMTNSVPGNDGISCAPLFARAMESSPAHIHGG